MSFADLEPDTPTGISLIEHDETISGTVTLTGVPQVVQTIVLPSNTYSSLWILLQALINNAGGGTGTAQCQISMAIGSIQLDSQTWFTHTNDSLYIWLEGIIAQQASANLVFSASKVSGTAIGEVNYLKSRIFGIP